MIRPPRLFTQVLAVFMAGFSLLVAVSLLSLLAFDASKAARDSARRAVAAREAVTDALSALKDVESRSRGYALTGDAGMRRDLEESRAALDSKLLRLPVFVKDGPETDRLLAELTDDARRRSAFSARLAEHARHQSPVERLRLMRAGREEMDKARAAASDIVARETDLEREHRERSATLAARARQAIYASLVLAVLLFAGATEAIRRTLAERERLEKLKEEVVSLASHELRTPLTIVTGAMKLLTEEEPGLSSEQRDLVDTALRNARRMLSLINAYLDLAALEGGRTRLDDAPLDLDVLAAEAVESMRHYATDRRVRFSLDAGARGRKAAGDAEAVSAVLGNLLSNAAKFSPEGGEVEVAVSAADGRARVSVRDHGPGIRPEFVPQVFRRFARDTPPPGAAKGTGLGLSISKALIERMGGRIWFETAPGEGTTFYLELPVAGAAA